MSRKHFVALADALRMQKPLHATNAEKMAQWRQRRGSCRRGMPKFQQSV